MKKSEVIVIGAIVRRRKKNRPKWYIFDVRTSQSEAELEMTRLGYGCGEYNLQHFSIPLKGQL